MDSTGLDSFSLMFCFSICVHKDGERVRVLIENAEYCPRKSIEVGCVVCASTLVTMLVLEVPANEHLSIISKITSYINNMLVWMCK